MPAQRRPGMDHEQYQWSPLSTRGVLRWPNEAHIALCILVTLDHMEWAPPKESYQSPVLAGGLGRRPSLDYARLTHREYGHRVGIFRVLDVLQKHQLPITLAMDALTAEHYPYLVEHCQQRNCEFIGHGVSVSQMITSRMTESEERDYIGRSLKALHDATGETPKGWFGPEYGESTRTPQLLAELGIRYVCDWANDEQPYQMTTATGDLVSLPIMLELEDIHALHDRRVPIERYRQLLEEGFEVLHADGAANGRMLVLHLHPWLIGQPFRIAALDRALGKILSHDQVWAAKGSEIVQWYKANPPT